MLFSSPVFLFLFLPAVLGLYLVMPRALRNGFLLLASLFFYWWAEPRFWPVLLGAIAVNYGLGLAMAGAPSRPAAARWLALAVTANVGLLAVYKYGNFARDNLNAVLAAVGAEPSAFKRMALPVGVSFFTFKAISYFVDVYRGQAPVQRNPLRLALYIAHFPELIAGPIVRYQHAAPQLASHPTALDDLAWGVRRFVIGLGKKLMIANTLAGPADAIFGLPAEQLTPGLAWLAVVCYTGQIYFDFSGYSDMALGLARMFGFRFLENFDYPYVSRTITEFWRRWHISLSTWLRDYIFLPLGWAENRFTRGRTNQNLLIVFFLCGLWHGASWTFVAWGVYHGAWLVVERRGLARWLAARWRPVQHAYALLVIGVGWVLFRATTLAQAGAVLSAMAGFSPGTGSDYDAVLYLDASVLAALAGAVVGSMPVVPWLAAWRGRVASPVLGAALDLGGATVLVLGLVVSLMLSAAGTHNPFIYFRF
jgi:alginate O-acetyltransferase complex protein AlgI